MRYALTPDEMRSAEEAAFAQGLTTLPELMDRAGRALADEVMRLGPSGPVVVACGHGNNGGDGWVAARLLAAAGRDVRVLAVCSPDELTGAARAAADRAAADGVPCRVLASGLDAVAEIAGAAVVLDAVFGFGFSGAPREPHASLLSAIADSDAFVIAADIPSGVDAETGRVEGAAVRADVTVTFSAPKPGLLLYPGAAHAGEIVVSDLRIPRELIDAAGSLELWDLGDYRSALPIPTPDAHKGTRGRVLVIAGSHEYAGAAVLACDGAMRMGAGYVFAAVPEPIVAVIQSSLPHVIARGLPATPSGALGSEAAPTLRALAAEADAVVLGPGITRDPETLGLVRALVDECSVPIVLDADGLFAFADPGPAALLAREAPLLLTPHAGEIGRLLGVSAAEVQADRVAAACALTGCARTCLLKGPRTVVASGARRAVTLSGNAALATAGTGDVLAGMLGTLLAQGLEPFEAAVLGSYLHGRAADIGAAELTPVCFTAPDVTRFLPAAVRELTGG